MARTKFSRIVYGEGKKIKPARFDTGTLASEIAQDFEEDGKKGVQGVKIEESEISRLLKYWGSSNVKDKELFAVAGLHSNGHLYVAIWDEDDKGFEQLAVAVKDYEKKHAAIKNQKNAVVNLTKKKKGSKGDETINDSVEAQGKQLNTAPKTLEDTDFSGITTGNVVLTAHGSATKVKGRFLGTDLGEKSPEEIVKILTKNSDPSKNLSPDFSGMVVLSGCFTAAGGIAPPEGYDYANFAEKVHKLLKKAGIKNARVRGYPGTTTTDDDGVESSVNPALQDEYDQEYEAWEEVTDKIEDVEKQLKKLWKEVGKSQEAFDKDPRKAKLEEKLSELNKLDDEIYDKKELKKIKELAVTYGLRVI